MKLPFSDYRIFYNGNFNLGFEICVVVHHKNTRFYASIKGCYEQWIYFAAFCRSVLINDIKKLRAKYVLALQYALRPGSAYDSYLIGCELRTAKRQHQRSKRKVRLKPLSRIELSSCWTKPIQSQHTERHKIKPKFKLKSWINLSFIIICDNATIFSDANFHENKVIKIYEFTGILIKLMSNANSSAPHNLNEIFLDYSFGAFEFRYCRH